MSSNWRPDSNASTVFGGNGSIGNGESSLLGSLTEFYFARYTQGEEPFNPFIATLLNLGPAAPSANNVAQQLASVPPQSLEPSAGLSIEASNAYWWFEPLIQPNERVLTGAAAQELQESQRILDARQREVLETFEHSRITLLESGAGTGKSAILVAAILRALARSTSINLSHSSQAVRMSAQRVLVICEPSAGRALTEKLARYLGADRLLPVHSRRRRTRIGRLPTTPPRSNCRQTESSIAHDEQCRRDCRHTARRIRACDWQ